MCGISGYYGYSNEINLENMTDCLKHRGPDSSGKFVDENLGIGVRRLAILDEEDGDQPVCNENKTVWTVFNGEIYNHKDLREKLKDKGHSFYSESDTEVIVHAYEEWGEKFVRKLEGMFAISLWDKKNEKLLLSRDKLGKKPLYIHQNNNSLIFGSEIKSILKSGKYEAQLNKQAVNQFLAYGYCTGKKTLFRNIEKVEPGETLILKNDNLKRFKSELKPFNVSSDMDSAAERLRSILKDNIDNWTREKGDFSVFLSGGVDSSAVLGLLSRHKEVNLKAYTASFKGSKYNEVKTARAVTGHFGVDHEVVSLDINAVNMVEDVVGYFDDLTSDHANIPYYLMSQRSSSHSKVAFTGSGADELYGGYEHHYIMDKGNRYLKKMPSPIRKIAPKIISRTPYRLLEHFLPYARDLGPKGLERVSYYVNNIKSDQMAYEAINAVFNKDELNQILAQELESNITDFENTSKFSNDNSSLRNIMLYEQLEQLPNRNFMKNDKAAMANGVELRSPLVTENSLRFSLGMENSLMRGGGKKVFRKAVQPFVPDNIKDRRKQRLFMPIHDWLVENDNWTLDEIERKYEIPSIIDENEIYNIVEGMNSSPLYYARQLWNLMHFIVWYNQHFVD